MLVLGLEEFQIILSRDGTGSPYVNILFKLLIGLIKPHCLALKPFDGLLQFKNAGICFVFCFFFGGFLPEINELVVHLMHVSFKSAYKLALMAG
jgi:hypothetical protein